MRKALLLFLIISGITTSLPGQNMHVSHFSEKDGLPSNEIRHVARDTLGFLWIATDNGLVRFDGVDFENYSQQLPSRYARHFCPVGEGILVSHDAGISLIRPGLDSTGFSMLMQASIDPESESLFYPDQVFRHSNGDLWIGQPGGRIDIIASSESRILNVPGNSPDHQKMKVCFAEVVNGQLWIASSEGDIYLYEVGSSDLELHTSLPQVNDMKSSGNELWIAGDHAYLLKLSDNGKQILKRETYRSDQGAISSLAIDSKGNIFAGIREKGLHFLNRRPEGDYEYIKIFGNNNPHQLNELPFKNIHKIVPGENDNLWICSSEGLGFLQRRLFESIGSIPNANTNNISISDNGKIFVGFGDIYVIESTEFGYEGSPLLVSGIGTVTAMTTAGDRLWVGTSTGMLFELTQSGRKLRSIDLRERGEGIYYLSYDSDDRLWVCQAPEEKPLTGIGCILPDGRLKEYGINEGVGSRLVCFRETSRGRFYASGHGKNTCLYRYLPEEETFINLSLPLDFDVGQNFVIHDFTIDDNGIFWLASTDGLLRYDLDRISKVDLGQEYNDVEIRAVVHMPDGSIWVSFDTEGVLRYKDGITLVMKQESGLPSKVMTYRCLVRDMQSRLWLGTTEGIVYSLKSNPQLVKSEKPYLVSGIIDGKKYTPGNMSLYPGQSLALEFISPSFHGFRTFYQYKLNDGEWSDPFTKQKLILDEWEQTDNIVQIRSRKEGGYLWSDVVKTNVFVKTYWYKEPYLIWVIAFAAAFSIFLAFRSQKRKLRNYMLKISSGLEEEKEELKKRDADLSLIREEIRQKKVQTRANLLVLEIMHRLISKIDPEMKWDHVIEIISIEITKLPGVVAFEIGTREGDTIEFEGYSEHAKNFFTARKAFDPGNCLAAYCIENANAFVFNDLAQQNKTILTNRDKRLDGYKSAISVPFYLGKKNAILSVYSDQKDIFDDYGLKAMKIFTTYLEQIM